MFPISVLLKEIAPQPAPSVGKLHQNTEPTHPGHGKEEDEGQLIQNAEPMQATDDENNQISQVVQVITHENKRNGYL